MTRVGRSHVSSIWLLLPICLAISSPSSFAAPAPAALSLEDVLHGIEVRGDLLHAREMTVRTEQFAHSREESADGRSFGGLPLFRTTELDMRIEGQKMHIDRRTISPQDGSTTVKELFAWDGRRSTGYSHEPQNPNDVLRGLVESRQRGAFEVGYWMTPLEMEVFDLREPLWAVAKKTGWRLAGTETVQDTQTYRIESVDLWNGKAALTVWVDASRDFAPLKLELVIHVDGDRPITETMDEVRLERRDGVWVIVDAVTTITNPYIEYNPRYVRRTQILDYRVGMAFPEGSFTVEFPPGTWVYDAILNTGYIAGKGVWVKNEEGATEFVSTSTPESALLDHGPEVETQPVNESTVQDATRNATTGVPNATRGQPRSSNRWSYLMVGVLIVVAAASILVWFRHRGICRARHEDSGG